MIDDYLLRVFSQVNASTNSLNNDDPSINMPIEGRSSYRALLNFIVSNYDRRPNISHRKLINDNNQVVMSFLDDAFSCTQYYRNGRPTAACTLEVYNQEEYPQNYWFYEDFFPTQQWFEELFNMRESVVNR